MKFSKVLLSFLTLSSPALFVACNDENPWEGSSQEGGIALNLTADGRVMRQTRADDSLSPVVPEASQFEVNLSKSDGAFSKHWNTLDAFNAETSFPMGDYSLTASFGDVNREGFENPCFSGSSDVHVSPGALTEAKVVATLANAMVSIRYTDEFKENFLAYSAALQTEGHDWVVFSQTEDRPAYISPSEVKLNLTLTDEYNRQVRIEPAGFTAQARHHYVVTIGVTGNSASGNLALDVQFDEDVVAETVNISLGEELFSAPAPSLTAKGFTPEVPVEMVEGPVADMNPEFHVFAFGGLKAATLNVISSNGYTPSFGKSVQLVNADPTTQNALSQAGVEASGFYRNVDKMGVVNIKKFLSTLPAGEYTVTLQAVDAMTRTTEPLSLSAKVEALDVALASTQEAEFFDSELSVDVTTNNPLIRDEVSFKAPDANNRMVTAPVKSVTQVGGTRSENVTYRYVIGVEPQVRSSLDVEIDICGRSYDVVVALEAPEYSIVSDPFSNRVVLKINAESDQLTRQIFDRLRFVNNSTQIPTANIQHDASSNCVTIFGFSAATTYAGLKAYLGDAEKQIPSFTTETEAQLPNNTFSSLKPAIEISPVQVGGKYKVSPVDYTIKSSISYNEPSDWATVNELTCYTGSTNKNTWFLVPSSLASNGAVTIRSVGYNHNGATPATSGGAFNTKYYCENAPSDNELVKAAGELFLGTYSFTGSENRTAGIAWNSRPASVSFDYSYTPNNANEKGEIIIEVLDAAGELISAKTELLSAASTTRHTVALPQYPFGKKAAKIKVGFKSTQSGVTPSLYIPSGSALNEGTGFGNKTIGANTYHALATGSVLVIDNVILNYGSSPNGKKRK